MLEVEYRRSSDNPGLSAMSSPIAAHIPGLGLESKNDAMLKLDPRLRCEFVNIGETDRRYVLL